MLHLYFPPTPSPTISFTSNLWFTEEILMLPVKWTFLGLKKTFFFSIFTFWPLACHVVTLFWSRVNGWSHVLRLFQQLSQSLPLTSKYSFDWSLCKFYRVYLRVLDSTNPFSLSSLLFCISTRWHPPDDFRTMFESRKPKHCDLAFVKWQNLTWKMGR